ncbi:alpha-glucoside transport system permease protein [Devosia enhydra]|uniref:Alpha-glucoside transport system permease protein n=1 Tax=Devosia enhydra TaxID=665118 RepID=A0A1K2I0T2_9HYPH|nr:carbohydrate ABC transporter permease [Devosia enhydra]SFZ85928.1 alpha-glucoside transport system permease protein [Devosia enhydra]
MTGHLKALRQELKGGRLALHAIVLVLCALWFTPIAGLVASSLRSQSEMGISGWWQIFVDPKVTLDNYARAIGYVGVLNAAGTSLALAIPVTILTTLLSAIGAYALVRLEPPRARLFAAALVVLLVLPPQVTVVPLLKLFVAIGLNGKVPAVWLYQVGFTIPYGVFLIRGFLISIPEEIFESAVIDGANPLQIFTAIVIPLCAPILAALAILQFLWSWNDLLIPLIFLGGGTLAPPITVQAAGIATSNGQDEPVLMAATCLSVALPLIILVSLQRYFVRGIVSGSVKG